MDPESVENSHWHPHIYFFFLVDISDREEYQKNGDDRISGYSISWPAAVWNDRYHEEF